MNKKIIEYLTYLWIILIPFQDSGLQIKPLNILGASPSFIPLLLIFALTIIFWFKNIQKIKNKTLLCLTFIITYVIVINSIYFFINNKIIDGSILIYKFITIFILYFLEIIPIFIINYDFKFIGKYIQISFLIAILGVFLLDILHISILLNSKFIHYTLNLNMRPRGLSKESSTLSATLLTLGFLSANYAKNKIFKLLYISASIVLSVYSGSKGGIIILFLLVFFMFFSLIRVKNQKIIWIIQLILLFLSPYLMYRFAIYSMRLLNSDINGNYTSVSTRLGIIVTSILIILNNPFGVGFTGFYSSIQKFVPIAINIIYKYINNVNFNFKELILYTKNFQDVSTKTFLFNFLIYYGIPFLIIFVLYNYRLFKGLYRKNKFLLVVYMFTLISLCTYIDAIGLYNITLVYGVCHYEVFNKKNINSNTRFSISS